ncbi:MAG TPA: phosphonoacetaldehyde hydrolase [Thiopseudomonas sp.]|nr:phosphonoacetaldehyde hydrolase [Thiopseudomonas sp.]
MYRYSRSYVGPVQAVILDLAGTCIDFGSLAPIQAFLKLFMDEDLAITEAEARGPMGTEKREHIRQLLAMPRIAQAWSELHDAVPHEGDIERLYQAFLPLQTAAIAERSELIGGALELQEFAHNHGIRLGVNTGYSREMFEVMLPALERQGFQPQSIVCATEVPQGRPAPYMSLRGMMELGAQAVQACVKVDDTATGIEEGLNAGMWTVAVAASGNALGLSEEQFFSLSEVERSQRIAVARSKIAQSGAHYVIDSIADLPRVIQCIQEQLQLGARP